MEGDGVTCHFIQAYASDARTQAAEVGIAQLLAQSYGLENLRAPVRTDGADAHLAHNLEQAFADGLDIFLFGSGVVELYLLFVHQSVDDGKSHIRIQCAGSEAQQQCGVHHFADFAAFCNQCRLHPFAHGDKMVVYRRHGKQ